MCFPNGARAAGPVQSIAGGRVAYTVNGRPSEVPLERVVEILFAGGRPPQARRPAAEVRALFWNGDRVTLTLDQVDAQALTGTDENASRLRIARSALRELQFPTDEANRGDTKDD